MFDLDLGVWILFWKQLLIRSHNFDYLLKTIICFFSWNLIDISFSTRCKLINGVDQWFYFMNSPFVTGLRLKYLKLLLNWINKRSITPFLLKLIEIDYVPYWSTIISCNIVFWQPSIWKQYNETVKSLFEVVV